MSLEKPSMPSPEEQAKIEKERTLSDADFLQEGAEYKIDEKGGKRLEITAEQVASRRIIRKSSGEKLNTPDFRGMRIIIERSSGEREDDWVIDHAEDDEVVVRKREKSGQLLEKTIPLKTLRKWNQKMIKLGDGSFRSVPEF